MKKLFPIWFLCCALVFVSALTGFALTPEEAGAKEGETVSVTSQCSNARKIKSGAIFVNFGGDYPNHTFSVYINPTDAAAFTDIESYAGKTFTVTGVVKLKTGKPTMEIKTPDQLVAAPAAVDAPAAK